MRDLSPLDLRVHFKKHGAVVNARDLTESRVIFARSPAEEAIDLGIFATPLDVLSIAQLRHDAPELADRIAEAAGRQFDRECAAKERPMSNRKLLPCPHCGEAEHLYPAYHGMGAGEPYAIDCLGCGADFVPREGMDVIAAWNRRPDDPRPKSKDAEGRIIAETLQRGE